MVRYTRPCSCFYFPRKPVVANRAGPASDFRSVGERLSSPDGSNHEDSLSDPPVGKTIGKWKSSTRKWVWHYVRTLWVIALFSQLSIAG